MISVAAYGKQSKELLAIEKISRLEAAKKTDDEWGFYAFTSVEALRKFLLEKQEITDILCYDITEKNTIEQLVEIRRENRQSLVILLVNNEISPLVYMKPSIMAASVMVKPLDAVQIKGAFSEILETICKSSEENNDEAIMIKQKEGNIKLSLDKILFFEAREKKIFANTHSKEYVFYDTLDSLLKRLPPNFARSHKGFIVNRSKIRRISLSLNEIELEYERIIPLSRTYKKDFKG